MAAAAAPNPSGVTLAQRRRQHHHHRRHARCRPAISCQSASGRRKRGQVDLRVNVICCSPDNHATVLPISLLPLSTNYVIGKQIKPPSPYIFRLPGRRGITSAASGQHVWWRHVNSASPASASFIDRFARADGRRSASNVGVNH